jgi:4-alpha-glucanotransferase
MDSRRASGILLHIISLPSPHGIGDLGVEAHEFVDALADSSQAIWQVLPIGPTGYGHSPYQSPSAFAGNPLLIDLQELARRGWLDEQSLADVPRFRADQVEYDRVLAWKTQQLREAFRRFSEQADPLELEQLQTFRTENDAWLADYAFFQALKDHFGGVQWTLWPEELRERDPTALAQWSQKLAPDIDFQRFGQWSFFRQWHLLREHAQQRGVQIVGDVPIFVAHDSADVWAGKHLFLLDPDGVPSVEAGVPPDYFSATGQLWGNPIYDWKQMAAEGYAWWIRRIRQAMSLFDLIRLDHFRGFVAHWEVPRGSPTAAPGRWLPGPGAALFTALQKQLGNLPILAENLGVITPPVEQLREEFGLPGMCILQFAFGTDPMAPHYRPHNFVENSVVYTGTHDNDTTVGWFRSQAGEGTTRTADEISRERDYALRYVGTDGYEIHWDFIRLAIASVARLAIFPMQDVLGLGTECRMNMPSTASGNWLWRMRPGEFTREHQFRLLRLAETFERKLRPPIEQEAP